MFRGVPVSKKGGKGLTSLIHCQSSVYSVSRVHQAVEALDPDRDVDGFIERRRNPENAPLYGVALCLLDWAMVDSGRDSIAKSQTQQQQKQQAEKRQGGVGAGEAARSIDSRGVGEVSGGGFQSGS